ncbi:MAG TPA: glycerophosphodiester phosphodiesterase family protein [Acidobacteriota bacterium]|nr:glycerophosphodiester phosphodiesterase family protein [Acidobacteriota bacterium]
MSGFKKVAHRGASGEYPENTRLAFAKAIAAGVDMIELDCQVSLDGHVVIFHDEKLKRTAGVRGAVRDKTLAQLKQLDIGRWRKKSFKGERILTLEEAVESVAGNADLCLEIKSFGMAPQGIELKVLFVLSHFDYLDRTVLSSFDYRCLARLRELAPEAALAVIYGSGVKEDPFAAARQLGAISIHVQKELATRDFLNQAWYEGLDVYVWTVNEVRDMEAFAALGVEGLISDFPEKFWKLKTR